MAQRLLRRRHRAEAHHLRLDAGDAEADDARHRLQAELHRLLLAHQQRHGDAVVRRAGVAGGDEQLLVAEALDAADRLQPRQALHVGAAAEPFVLVEDDHFAALVFHPLALVVEDRRLDLERDDLVLVDTVVVRLGRPALAVDSVLVQRLAAEVVHLCDVLRRLRHRHQRRRVQDVVRNVHGEVVVVVGRHVALLFSLLLALAVELGDARLFATAAAGQRTAHALDAEGDAAFSRAHHDRLGDAVQRLHARAALAIRVERADLRGQPGHARDDVGADTGQLRNAQDVAHADVVDHARLHFRVALHHGPQDLSAGFIHSRRHHHAAAAAGERGAGGVDQHYVLQLHVVLLTYRLGIE